LLRQIITIHGHLSSLTILLFSLGLTYSDEDFDEAFWDAFAAKIPSCSLLGAA
jgi:hypothetical protein